MTSRDLTLALSLLAAACGGKVVFDGAPSNGGGGAGGTTLSSMVISSSQSTASSVSAAGGGPPTTCLNPPPPGSLTVCGGSSGTGAACSFGFCDSAGNHFDADCTGATCICRLNFQTLCTCALNGSGDICAGTDSQCCPFFAD